MAATAKLRVSPQRARLTHIAECLAVDCQIDTIPRYQERYVLLHTQELFDRLVNIFTHQFQFLIHHRAFKHLLHEVELTGRSVAAARAYISCWFCDLYVSNRECQYKMSLIAYNQHYSHYDAYTWHFQDRYDPFLQNLNAVIRPTRTPHSLEVWIPLIRANVAWDTDNPFDITGWNADVDLVRALLGLMKQKNGCWHTIPLSQDATGRPMWLLDWHDQQAYAWFPMDAHYPKEDLVAAYILGIPCTPNLGSRDRDDWQYFVNHTVPANATPQSLQRGTQRQFLGSAEHRTVDFREWVLPDSLSPGHTQPAKKQKTWLSSTIQQQLATGSDVESDEQQTSPSATMEVDAVAVITAPQYQITDWCYHARVISGVHVLKQNDAIRHFLFID